MSILRGVTKNLTSLRESVASSVSTAEGIINSVKKDNAAKRKNTANDAKLFRKRRNNILRQEREDALEASTVTGSLKRTGKVIQKSNKSFLGRIMDFVGTLLIGWAVTTLPKIIGSAEDVMKRGQLFIRNMEEFVKGIGDIITATTIGILEVVGAAANFDFKQMGDSIKTAAQRVQLGFTRMQLSVDRAFQILSRPMSELLGVTEKDFELSEEAEEEEIQARQVRQFTSQSTSQQTEPQGEQREVNTGSVDTGYKDYKGRPIKLSPQAAKAFIKMAKDAEAQGIPNLGSYITSHFRSEEKNENVGGVRGSKHLTGNAIDINMLNTGPGDEWIQKNGAKYGFIYNGYKPDSTHFDFDPTKVTVPLEPPKTKTPPVAPLRKEAPPEPEPQGGFDFLEFMKKNNPYNLGLPQKQSKTVNVPYPVVASAPPVQKTAPSSMMPSAGRLNNTLYDVQLNSPALT